MLITENEFASVIGWLDRQREIALDTETTGLDAYRLRNRICGISMSGHDGSNLYLPFRHGTGYNLPTERLYELTAYLSRRTQAGILNLVTWNAKFDLHMLAADGFEPPLNGCIEDAMLGAHLLNENEPSFGLKEYSDKYGFGRGSLDEIALRDHIARLFGPQDVKGWKGNIWKLPAHIVAPYAEMDTILTLAARNAMRQPLAYWNLDNLFAEVNDYMLLIWRMERRGIRLDTGMVEEQMRTLGPKRTEAFEGIVQIVRAQTGDTLDPTPRPVKIGKRGLPLKTKPRETFNPNSVPQLQALTGWERTDVRFIEELADDDPYKAFGELVLDYRVLSKMSGTYYDAYLSLIDETDTLRPNYNMHGTVNGRLSCSKPNMQNVPRYTERRPVKSAFIPRDGYVFVEMDYEQAELRIATHYADEPRMRAVFYAGLDPHTETATKLGIPRFVAKTLNFLIIYGGGVRAASKTLKTDNATAKAYISGYHGLYPNFQRLSNHMMRIAERDGYIRMETGRIRHFNTWKQHKWESEPRKAMNSLIQGTSSEMLRIGMQRTDEAFRALGLDAHMLLQVHDSILLECRNEDLPTVVSILQSEMTSFAFDPQPAIAVKAGTKWAPMDLITR